MVARQPSREMNTWSVSHLIEIVKLLTQYAMNSLPAYICDWYEVHLCVTFSPNLYRSIGSHFVCDLNVTFAPEEVQD